MGSRSRGSVRWFAVVAVALVAGAQGTAAQDSAESGTRALRWAKLGAVGGGVFGGLGLGLLAEGLCEASCDNAFLGGFLYGAAGGGILGGTVGLILGAALPARDASAPPPSDEAPVSSPSARGWALDLNVAPRWASGEMELGDGGLSVSVRAIRPTTSGVAWGLEVGHHGSGRSAYTEFFPNPDGSTQRIERRAARRLWSATMIATRTVGVGGRGYLLASAGVYPRREARTTVSTGDGPVPSWSETSLDPYPGIGIGGGGRWRVRPSVSVGVEGRGHAILGPGLWTIGSLGVSIQFGH